MPSPKTPGLLATWDSVAEFVFAGNATFTLRSMKTGARYTYKLRALKRDIDAGVKEEETAFFANLLRGQDNTADFAYMGVVRRPGRFFWTSASGRVGREAPAYKALMWFLQRLSDRHSGVLGTALEVWHEGRCGACGRKLTVPESIAAGLGPECAGRRFATPLSSTIQQEVTIQ